MYPKRLNNFNNFFVYRTPDIDNSIYDCLMIGFGNIQESDRKALFLLMGDSNVHSTEWFGSAPRRKGANRLNVLVHMSLCACHSPRVFRIMSWTHDHQPLPSQRELRAHKSNLWLRPFHILHTPSSSSSAKTLAT